MLDSEDEVDDDHRWFYRRLAAAAVVTIAAAVALWPSVTGFTVGVDANRSCVAIRDGWHADRSPDAAENAVIETYSVHPTAQQMRAIERANARLAWLQGPGACVPESRHRLIISGAGLIGLMVAGGAIVFVRRRARRGAARGASPQTVQVAASAR